jgi:hypothetical protein
MQLGNYSLQLLPYIKCQTRRAITCTLWAVLYIYHITGTLYIWHEHQQSSTLIKFLLCQGLINKMIQPTGIFLVCRNMQKVWTHFHCASHQIQAIWLAETQYMSCYVHFSLNLLFSLTPDWVQSFGYSYKTAAPALSFHYAQPWWLLH